MNLRLALLRVYFPVSLKREAIREIMNIMAISFGRPVPAISSLQIDEMLEAASLFAREGAKEAVLSGSSKALKEKLYNCSLISGEKYRKKLGIRSFSEALSAVALLYKAIEIDLCPEKDGNFLVKKCYFSSCFSPEICGIIASMDEGIVRGLSGGKLTFKGRLTEGREFCSGSIEKGDLE